MDFEKGKMNSANLLPQVESTKNPIRRRSNITADLSSKNILLELQNINEINISDLKLIVMYILSKENKTPADISIITFFLSKIDKLVLCIKDAFFNYMELLHRIAFNVNFLHLPKNKILFRAFDIADKFFFIIQGKVSIIVKQVQFLNMNEYEYLDYLLTLKSLNEISLLNNILNQNKKTFPIDYQSLEEFWDELYFVASGKSKQNFLITSFMREKPLYQELKDKIITICKRTKKALIKMKTIKEKKASESPSKSKVLKSSKSINNKGPDDEFEITTENYCTQFIPKEITIDEINYSLLVEKKITLLKKEIASSPPKKEKGTITFSSPNKHIQLSNAKTKQLCFANNSVIGKSILSSDIKSFDAIGITKLVNLNLLKRKGSDKQIVERTCPDDEYVYQCEKLKKQSIKIYNYIHVNSLGDLSVFGDLGMNKADGERTASVITLEDTYFGFLTNYDYRSNIKECFDRKIKLNLNFLNEYGLFNGFLNKNEDQFLNYFLLKEYNNKNVVFEESRDQMFLIKEGVFRLSINASLSKIDQYSRKLGDDTHNSLRVIEELDSNQKFRDFYNKTCCIPLYDACTRDLINIELLDFGLIKRVKDLNVQVSSSLLVDEEVKIVIKKELASNIFTLDFKLECISHRGEVFRVNYEEFYSKIFKYDSHTLENYIISKNKCMIKRLKNLKETKLRQFFNHQFNNNPSIYPALTTFIQSPKIEKGSLKVMPKVGIAQTSSEFYQSRSKLERKLLSANKNTSGKSPIMNCTMTTNSGRAKANETKQINSASSRNSTSQIKKTICFARSGGKSKTLQLKAMPYTLKLKAEEYLKANLQESSLNKAIELDSLIHSQRTQTNVNMKQECFSNANFSIESEDTICFKLGSTNKRKNGGSRNILYAHSDTTTHTDYEYPRKSFKLKENSLSAKLRTNQLKIRITKKNIANAQMEIFRPKKLNKERARLDQTQSKHTIY